MARPALGRPEGTDMAEETTKADEKKTDAKSPILAEAEKQEAILNALQAVLDPEIGLSVIDLDLIREVTFTPEEAEVRMVLTTPFCPYGPMLINQIQSVSEQAAEMPVKVTVLPDRWEPPPWLR
jgi:metal-sulfur cluster biosynthetic enzyme